MKMPPAVFPPDCKRMSKHSPADHPGCVIFLHEDCQHPVVWAQRPPHVSTLCLQLSSGLWGGGISNIRAASHITVPCASKVIDGNPGWDGGHTGERGSLSLPDHTYILEALVLTRHKIENNVFLSLEINAPTSSSTSHFPRWQRKSNEFVFA